MSKEQIESRMMQREHMKDDTDGHLCGRNKTAEPRHGSEHRVYEQLLMLCPLEAGMQLEEC